MLSATGKRHMIAVGCQGGTFVLLEVAGRQLAVGNMEGPVTSVFFVTDGVITGSAKGMVRHYSTIR